MIQKFELILAKYIPKEAAPLLAKWLVEERVKLRITKPRKTKLGDYRAPHAGQGHQISVNVNLNQYSFLITLVHEFAHLYTWKAYRHKVKSHGLEWKQVYIQLMKAVFPLVEFPKDIHTALDKYMQNPLASSCTDINLQMVLMRYDLNALNSESPLPLIQYIQNNTVFEFRGKQYQRIEQVRKRIKCIRMDDKRIYLFSPLAQVEPIGT